MAFAHETNRTLDAFRDLSARITEVGTASRELTTLTEQLVAGTKDGWDLVAAVLALNDAIKCYNRAVNRYMKASMELLRKYEEQAP